ncbi:DUF2185 domain-containing protein [Herbiconiux sp. L3-i23]|uniref:immunity protein Imm33 domain-containing protein n=1 Tax=Herbiconiux sp. L3-i23 TaxID=2905871 RepID=UPI00204E4726|nr:DUF2185 domain-containing protein [Herbiconiux sp. L3-i23]BDI23686.1 hypothetical protein L3i23_24620 [Herbiconiux sp. L3-i23]
MTGSEQVTSLVSSDVVSGGAPIRWAFRREPDGPGDTGWRLYSGALDGDIDIEDEGRLIELDYAAVVAIEPAMVALWSTPVGADLQFIRPESGDVLVWDNSTDKPFEYLAG